MKKLAIALALTISANAYAKDAAFHRKAWIRKDYTRFIKADFSEPCSWKPRKGTTLRFLSCPFIHGAVSETLSEFQGANNFKPWLLVTDVTPDGSYAIVYVTPPGFDNSPEGEDNPKGFNACLPTDLLPKGAKLHDSFTFNETAYKILMDWRTSADHFE